jgi:hypothetical protein
MRTPPFCRSCGAEITWSVVAPGGKRMPLDRVSIMDGRLIATGNSFNGTIEVRALTNVERATLDAQPGGGITKRYASHFQTCPNAGEHRRR